MTLAAPRPAPSRTRRVPPAWRCWRAPLCALTLATIALAANAQRADGDVGTSTRRARQVLVQVNLYRTRLGLSPLQADAALARIAREHSEAMARRGHLGHDGFAQRFARADAAWCAENLGAGAAGAAELVAAWRASPAHDDNLRDGRVLRAGIASVAGYVTLLACEGAPVEPDDPPS